jgi:hypothetical protein
MSSARRTFDCFYPVVLNKGDLLSHVLDILNSLSQRFGIPARFDSFAVLAVFQETAPGGENPAVKRSVSENGLESEVP